MLSPPQTYDLLPRIPLSARTILHVGCGDGTLAAAYRRMSPRTRLLGIESDSPEAERAALHMDEVATADIEADPIPFEVPDGIDCIIYNEVLERLGDPWALVRRHAAALGPDGVMLICVRNVEHWRDTERLLRGTCQDGGTEHGGALPPWCSLDGMRQRLLGIGLTLGDVTAREADSAAAKSFVAALAPGLAGLGIDPREYGRRAGASHFIWRACKEPFERMILSGSMLDPIGGVSHVRVVHPLHAVGTDPAVVTSVTDQVSRQQLVDGTPRIFVLHRPSLMRDQGLETLRQLTDAGYLIVTEFDDHPDHFPMMRAGGDLSFVGAHALQTSTAAMANALRKYNPEIAVFPNAMVSLPDVRNFADPRCVTMFFGALNREPDWQPLIPVINAVAEKAGERLRFQVVHDQEFFDALDTPHKTFTPTCDYDTYMRLLGESEVSFMPLSDTPFNRAKSDLKFIEAGACRVAALASSVVYGDSIEDGRTGLLFRDPVEFHSRLLRLVAMPELARNLGDAARIHVAEHRMLAYQVAPRIAWYRSLWARRDALSEARRARMMLRLRPTA